MAIQFTCQCGKLLAFKEEYAGRQAICPGCKRSFVVSRPGANVVLEHEPENASGTDESHAGIPGAPVEIRFNVPRTGRGTAPPGLATGSNISATEPSAGRPWWKDPIVVIGATVPSLILAVFLGYLGWSHYIRHEGRLRDGAVVAVGAKEMPPPEPAPPLPPPEPEKPKVILKTEDEFRRYAMLASTVAVQQVLQGKCDHYRILDSSVERGRPDPRKVPDRWDFSALVAITLKPDHKGLVGETTSWNWNEKFFLTPALEIKELLRVITNTRTGQVIRKHFEVSEWTEQFHRAVVKQWSKEFRDHQAWAKEKPLNKEEQRLDLMDRQELVAGIMEISIEDLLDILETAQ